MGPSSRKPRQIFYYKINLTILVLSLFVLTSTHGSSPISESSSEINATLRNTIELNNNDNEDGTGNNYELLQISTATTLKRCGKNCCFQYTWLGYIDKEFIPPLVNSSCEYFKEVFNSENLGCIDPIIYTRNASAKLYRTPPNDTILAAEAMTNTDRDVFCSMAGGKSCVTYTIYNAAGKVPQNITKFCGTVLNSNTNDELSNGCFRQSLQGRVREVCVCNTKLCNKGYAQFPPYGSFNQVFDGSLVHGFWGLLGIFIVVKFFH